MNDGWREQERTPIAFESSVEYVRPYRDHDAESEVVCQERIQKLNERHHVSARVHSLT